MGFKIKNSLTGEFEKLPILTLKGEKGETGGVEEYNKVDYMGNKYETLKQANDANVEYAVKTAIGEFNYLDYDGQHITATDTIEGRSKSAILTGQTLVNLFNTKNIKQRTAEKTSAVAGYDVATGTVHYITNLEATNPYNYSYVSALELGSEGCAVNTLKPNTTYTVKWFYEKIKDTDPSKTVMRIGLSKNEWGSFSSSYLAQHPTIQDGICVFTTPSEFPQDMTKSLSLGIMNASNTLEYKVRYVVLEGDHTNVDIPYFEGMQSVRMPVLKSTGKNLVDLSTSIYGEGINSVRTDFIKINPNKTFIASMNNQHGSTVYFYTQNKEEIFSKNGFTAISPSNAYYLKWVVSTQDKTADWNSFQIEEGSTATSYEPHKSNILTVNEEVELRGIGEIQDTLDCLTGELTQRIGEDVLDGSQGLTITGTPNQENTLCVLFPDFPKIGNGVVMSDELIKASNYDYSDTECITQNAFGIAIRLLRNRLESADINGVKKFLSQNPITVQYQLETESVKTVDLSDNHVYSYKDVTHYDCSSAEGSLVPTLSVKVPTDVQATIAQQRETIQTLNSENERLNQIQEVLKASMLDSQVQLMNLSWNTDFEVFTLRESIAPKDFLLASRTGSNIDKFSQAKFIIENDCPDLEKLNSQIEYYFSKDVFSQEQFEELTDLISIVKGENGCEY